MTSLSSTLFSTNILLLRGPCFVAVCTIAIAFPYLSAISITLLLQILGIGFGLILFSRDVSILLENRLRKFIDSFVSSVVLDDVLKAIFDPQVGLIATSLGTYMGNMAMYTLPMNPEQRTRLIQASLWTEEDVDGSKDVSIRSIDEARSILQSPGGCKLLFPKNIQDWLRTGQDEDQCLVSKVNSQQYQQHQHRHHHQHAAEYRQGDREKANLVETSVTDGESSIADDSGFHMEYEEDDRDNNQNGNDLQIRIPVNHDDGEAQSRSRPTETPVPTSTTPTASPPPPPVMDPVEVMLSILQEMGKEKLQRVAQAIPDASLETVGLSAAIAVVLHLALRRRPRRIVAGALEGFLALSLSGVSIGALSAAVARHFILERSLPRIVKGENGLSLDSSKRMAGVIWNLLKRNLNRKGKSILAMIVLMIVGRRR